MYTGENKREPPMGAQCPCCQRVLGHGAKFIVSYRMVVCEQCYYERAAKHSKIRDSIETIENLGLSSVEEMRKALREIRGE